jgi:fermentation-respiration switch protein FrsA (DUF1100 family)
MKSLLSALLLLLSIVTAVAQQSPIGDWLGKIDMGPLKIRAVLHVKKQAGGKYLATVDSPDQGVLGHETDSFSAEGDTVKFEAWAAKFLGKISADGRQIVGTLTQGGKLMALTFTKQDKPLNLAKPQDPQPPYPYDTEDVSYVNKAQNVTLAGTLTIPRGTGPFPAVLLITGSGVQNRDEEILGHRPFKVLADYLTRRGIEVLRVDDRGIGGSTGDPKTATTADFVTDVARGVAFLKARKEVNQRNIGLIGHSEGGIIAPIVASKSKDVAFIVLMAGTGISGKELLPLQALAIERASGVPEAKAQESVTAQRRMLEAVVRTKDPVKLRQEAKAIIHEQYAHASPLETKGAPTEDQAVDSAMAQLSMPWLRYFLTLDPAQYLSKVKCPVLAVNGSLDTQVPAKENLAAIEAALKRGNNRHYVVRELPGLNHLFQTAKTGSPSEYTEIQETISPTALQMMGDWILSVVR